MRARRRAVELVMRMLAAEDAAERILTGYARPGPEDIQAWFEPSRRCP